MLLFLVILLDPELFSHAHLYGWSSLSKNYEINKGVRQL